ncbi:hypothetical protein DWQ65_00585 [Treponema phagedenis]|nr:hypothetical protein C5O78_03605 [Treponema phagedenis]QSH98585.1 hypothetical protein DWQ65_00585 [Treponema phagedenis]
MFDGTVLIIPAEKYCQPRKARRFVSVNLRSRNCAGCAKKFKPQRPTRNEKINSKTEAFDVLW